MQLGSSFFTIKLLLLTKYKYCWAVINDLILEESKIWDYNLLSLPVKFLATEVTKMLFKGGGGGIWQETKSQESDKEKRSPLPCNFTLMLGASHWEWGHSPPFFDYRYVNICCTLQEPQSLENWYTLSQPAHMVACLHNDLMNPRALFTASSQNSGSITYKVLLAIEF